MHLPTCLYGWCFFPFSAWLLNTNLIIISICRHIWDCPSTAEVKCSLSYDWIRTLHLWSPTPPEEGMHIYCGVTEDEEHFLFNCGLYDGSKREDLFSHCTSLNCFFKFMSSQDKFITILLGQDLRLPFLLADLVRKTLHATIPVSWCAWWELNHDLCTCKFLLAVGLR